MARFIMTAAVIAASFLVLTRPVYLIFAIGGVLIALALRALLPWMRDLYTPWPGIGTAVFELIAVCFLGMIPVYVVALSSLAGPYVPAILGALSLVGVSWWARRKARSKRAQRLFLLFIFPLTFFGLSVWLLTKIGSPRPFTVHYAGTTSIKGQEWVTKHVISVPDKLIASDADTDKQAVAYPRTKAELEACGWKEEIIGTFSKISDQPIASRWLPFKTLNALNFPAMSCQDMIFDSDATSSLTLTAPRFEIAKTDPDPKSRTEKLDGDNEVIILPIEFRWDVVPAVQLQLISPLLRSRIGDLLLSGAAWEPIKWILLVVCGLFAEQIKKGLIVPFVKWIFKVLHLPYSDGEKVAKSEAIVDSQAT